jgi:protein gp37
MADHSHIEWTDATWNPITGCSVVSPGCTNCYAMKLAGTRLQHHPSRAGLTRASKAGPVWTSEVRFNEQWLTQPLRWTKPRMIFVCAHGDLFHEDVPDEWIDRVFAVMALAPQHTFQVLTKRAARMRAYLSGVTCDGARRFNVAYAAGRLMEDGDNAHDTVVNASWPLPNVWLGVSAEDQARANERIPDLLSTPASIRFVSAEPLLGAIDFSQIAAGIHDDFKDCGGHPDPAYPIDSVVWGRYDALRGEYWSTTRTPDGVVHGKHEELGFTTPSLDWVIVGGESGPGARPMHPDWARSIRGQCAAAGVPFFFKQWGSWFPAIDRQRDDPHWRQDYRFKYDDAGKYKWLNLAGGRGFHGERFHVMANLGKARSGRLLDGAEHNGMPRVPR